MQNKLPQPNDTFYDFPMYAFPFEQTTAQLILPQTAANGRWLFKTEYLGAFPAAELALLQEGFCVAHVDNESRWGRRQDTERQIRFASYITNTFGLAPQCGLVGMSCGGMQAILLAAAAPQAVSAIYLDAPVVDLCSCPLDFAQTHQRDPEMIAQCLQDHGKTAAQMLKYRSHPYDYLKQLAAYAIPTLLVAADSDSVVPFSENGVYLQQAYHAAGTPLQIILKPGADHHPHGLPDRTPIISFLREYA